MKNILTDASVTFDSPIGEITVFAFEDAITQILIGGDHFASGPESSTTRAAQKSILKYLNGKSKDLHLKVSFDGTDFQKRIWQAISEVPFGETTTYKELAIKAQSPAAVRAAGQAVGSNPIPLVIGCHRVLGANNKITGYSGGEGLPTKRKLLALEKIHFVE